MSSLPELQRRFAADLTAAAGARDAGIAVYRNTVRANYRNALGATYRVVREVIGDAAFAVAVDAFADACPSTGGDLNVYGGEFAQFLALHPPVLPWPHVPDVARLEWAIDDAHRAADADGSAERTLAALAAIPGADVARQRFTLDPSCRFLQSPFPVLRLWRDHQPEASPATTATGDDCLLVRREAGTVVIERLAPGDHAWLAALAGGADLAGALDAALSVDPTFDLGTALRTFIANGTLTGIVASAD